MFENCWRCGGGPIAGNNDSYRCIGCGLTVWKEKSGRIIDREVAMILFSRGRTDDVIEGFISKSGSRFSAGLKFENGKLVFWFPPKSEVGGNRFGDVSEAAVIRIEADRSGSSFISINGPFTQELYIEYGLVPARESECLALITAVKILKHKAPQVRNVSISCNDLDLSRYLLCERSPRDKAMRNNLEYLRALLRCYSRWDIRYNRRCRYLLKGSVRASVFPRGAFPWLRIETFKQGGVIRVRLPSDPAVIKQFSASFYNVTQETREGDHEILSLPVTAEKALIAWFRAVTGEVSA